jgi:hypothetical protein
MTERTRDNAGRFDATVELSRSDYRIGVAAGSPLRHIADKAAAAVRIAYIGALDLPYPQRLLVRRSRVHSPGEEDGILFALLAAIGGAPGEALELGLPPEGTLIGAAVTELGYGGRIVDGAKRPTAAIARVLAGRDAVRHVSHQCPVGSPPDLTAIGVQAAAVALLSISSAWGAAWTWEQLPALRAAVVMLPYDAGLGLAPRTIVDVDGGFGRPAPDREGYVAGLGGASIGAIERAADRLGYRLVVIEPFSCTAFLLRSELGPEIPALSAARALDISRGERSDLSRRLQRAEQAGLLILDG